MKQLFSILPATLMLAGLVCGQDSAAPSSENASGSMPTAKSTRSGSGGYSSEGYGRRAEVFVTGFGLLTSSVTGNAIAHDATTSGGGSAGYRFHVNSWSAIEARYGFSRNSQKYTINGAVSSIPAYLSEITGSYVYSFPKLRSIWPFLEAGGGVVHFGPGDYGGGPNSPGGNPTGGGGGYVGPYSIIGPSQPATQRGAPVYTGSSPGVSSQTRPTFVYGIGVDLPVFSHFSIRAEYRELAFKQPDFNLTGLKTDAFGFLSEPSIGVAYRF